MAFQFDLRQYGYPEQPNSCPASFFAFFMAIIVKNLIEPKPTTSPRIYRQYDFVIIGGGTAGCVLANRLSEIPHWKVLLLEAGPEEPEVIKIPGLSMLWRVPELQWGYKTTNTPSYCGKESYTYTRGKMLGGCSSHDLMVYYRGNRKIYDEWSSLGNEGWSYDEVLPYFKKSEDNRDGDIAADTKHHAIGGYLKVEKCKEIDINDITLMKGLKELGYKWLLDQNAEVEEGFAIPQHTISNGEYLTANGAFLTPIRHKRPNLHVVTNAHVTKILIHPKTKRTYGVSFSLHEEPEHINVYISKDVVLSAGTMNSPQILQLSGVGPPEILKPLGIPVLSGTKVGYNYQDQTTYINLIEMKMTKTAKVPESYETVLEDMEEYNTYKTGAFARGIPLHLRTYSKSAKDGITDIGLWFIQSYVQEDTDNCPKVENLTVPWIYYNRMAIFPMLSRMKSRGMIYINSSDPFDPPVICPCLFSDKGDFGKAVEAAELMYAFSQTKAVKEVGWELTTTASPECPNFPSKEYWECYLPGKEQTFNKAVGSCKMGPDNDPDAVCGPRLRVHGVKRLRLADASIMPRSINTNLVGSVIMIAERCAKIIKEDWLTPDSDYKRTAL